MENVIIRKPTDDEQRNGKIITSDYLISALTIHSSVLKTLGFIDKVYRSKQAIVVPSNKKLLMKYSKNLNYLMRTFGYSKTPNNFNEFRIEIKNNKDFIKHLIDNKVATWSQIGGKEKLPKIARKYHTATTFIRAVEAIELFFDMFNEDGLEDIIYAKTSSEPLQKIAPHIKEVLNSNIRPSVYKHSQTIVWQKALAKQKEIEKELGKNFTPKKYAEFYLSADTLDLISYYWKLDLLNYDGSWDELCSYLYSPEIISIIRNNLNVNVRARSTFDTRKGVETSDKKKFVKLIEVQKKILGENFNKEDEELKIAELENKLILYKAKYNEAKLLKKYSDKEDREFAIKEVEKYKNKYYYYKTAVTKAKQLFDKKVKAHCNLETYTAKHNLIKEIIEETRS